MGGLGRESRDTKQTTVRSGRAAGTRTARPESQRVKGPSSHDGTLANVGHGSAGWIGLRVSDGLTRNYGPGFSLPISQHIHQGKSNLHI